MPTEILRRSAEGAVSELNLPFDITYIPDEYRRKAKSELFEDEDTRVNSLRLLKQMLNDEKDLHWQDDDQFLLSFLRARKFDVKRAFNLVKTFYTVKKKHVELYHDFSFDLVRRTLEDMQIGFLPYRCSEGCAILVIRTMGWEPHVNNLGDVMRALTCGLLYANLFPVTTIAGFKVIFDFEGFTFRHLPHVSPTYLWLFAEALQNCFPGRFRAVHMVNEGYIFSYIWAVLKQLLSKKLRDRFHFHNKNVKKLHKYFSPSILPAEYEGKQPSYNNSEWAEKFFKSEQYIHEAYSYGWVEKHRK